MRRVLLPAVIVLAAVAIVLRSDASGDAPGNVVLGVGDTMEVDGAPIGCKVNRRNGRIGVECRRAGKPKGTYVTLFDARRLRVARFTSRDEAKLVFTARHRGRARMCDSTAAARAAGEGRCR
jgi:hypothetical protein